MNFKLYNTNTKSKKHNLKIRNISKIPKYYEIKMFENKRNINQTSSTSLIKEPFFYLILNKVQVFYI